MEKLYIQVYNSTDKAIGYNLTFGGDGGIPTEEVKKKISEAMKGKEGYWNGKQGPNKGKHHSIETKKKLAAMKKGKPRKKLKWRTPSGDIVEMSIAHVKQWHPDWILLEE